MRNNMPNRPQQQITIMATADYSARLIIPSRTTPGDHAARLTTLTSLCPIVASYEWAIEELVIPNMTYRALPKMVAWLGKLPGVVHPRPAAADTALVAVDAAGVVQHTADTMRGLATFAKRDDRDIFRAHATVKPLKMGLFVVQNTRQNSRR